MKTPFWFRFEYFHISFRKCLAGVSYTMRKNICKFVFKIKFWKSWIIPNRSSGPVSLPTDNCDIVVIYMKSTENKKQVTSCSFTDTVKLFFCCDCMIKFALKSVIIFRWRHTMCLNRTQPSHYSQFIAKWWWWWWWGWCWSRGTEGPQKITIYSDSLVQCELALIL